MYLQQIQLVPVLPENINVLHETAVEKLNSVPVSRLCSDIQ